MPYYRLLFKTSLILSIFIVCSPIIKISNYPWYTPYSHNQLDSAETALHYYLEQHPKDLTSHCYYAETLRRLKKYPAADSIAGKILSIDSCNSFIWCVKGNIASSQYTVNYPFSDDSIALFYYLKAIGCDSSNGDAWEYIWIRAMEKNNTELENLALKKLYEINFYTPFALSYARWLLADLPENAVLVTNGDMDTYPLQVVQQNEKIRSDVAVVNISLLNMKWYFELMCNRHDIPTGFTADELKNLERVMKDDSTFTDINDKMLNIWHNLINKKEYPRPLCYAITIDSKYSNPIKSNLVLCGPFYQTMADSIKKQIDSHAVYRSLKRINPKHFKGPFISTIETSPILINSGRSRTVDINIAALAFRAAMEFSGESSDTLAYEVLDWFDNYLKTVNGSQELRQNSKKLRQAIINGELREQR